jgi:hydroxymethylglutaryl-CoA reductase
LAKKNTSRIPGLYDLPLDERIHRVLEAAGLETAEGSPLPSLTAEQADHMIENVIGLFGLPLGIALNFMVNGRDVLVPMAVEEPSVVAGASFMAKLVRQAGGFEAETTAPEMIGQIQILDVPDPEAARKALADQKPAILAEAEGIDPVLSRLGGGPRDLEVRLLQSTPAGPMLVLHLIYDTRDAMGANAVNTAVERLRPLIESITGGRVHLRILSNLADRRLARARCRIPAAAFADGDKGGLRVARGIVEASAFAEADPYRAATHNKGIMNGVDAVVLATGNDWRAVEAGAHAYAARSGRYTSLSQWRLDEKGFLEGSLEMPLAVGTVGGATRVHPLAQFALRLMGVGTARELAEIIVSVGLAQNLAALRALASEGIQRGHMELHARQVAVAAGAVGEEIEKVARLMVAEGTVRLDRAQAWLTQTRNPDGTQGQNSK